MAAPTPSTHLGAEHRRYFQDAFERDRMNLLALNAVTKNSIQDVALNRAVVASTDHTFSHTLKSNESVNQAKSGRCWMFAGLNLFRVEAIKRLNVKNFELSQSYLMFWDKLEKANYFLETILATLDEPTNGRLIMFLLRDPIQDGGQWDMFVNLVRKYGVMPKTAMPETESSSNSNPMNTLITIKLQEYAAELRCLHDQGAGMETLRARKLEMMAMIYRMLCIHLGQPPQDFLWQWRDQEERFHRDGVITPHEFFRRYIGFDLDSMVCLIHAPTADKPFDRLYTIQHLGNVVEGHIIRYLNVDMAVFRKATLEMIVDGRPVWFGCDVGKMLERKLGILDMDLYDYDLVYGAGFASDKAQRLDYGQSLMTHAMVFTGVDLDETQQPIKWRVENSWGSEIGDKGFLVMRDDWFGEYMYEVVVDRKFVPEALLPILETEPVVLPPWDPMGSLAMAK
jgi:bleomycin hydrolase